MKVTLLVIILIVGTNIVLAQQIQQQPKKVPVSQNNGQSQNNSTATDWWLIRFSAVLALVAVFQFILAVRQAKWMRTSQRAFVFMDMVNIGNITGSPPPEARLESTVQSGPWIFRPEAWPVAAMIVKNSGQTPAYDVIHWSNICFREHPLVAGLSAPLLPPSHLVTKIAIPPGGATIKGLLMERPLTSEEVEQLKDGTAAIYLHGKITYKDAFRKKRFTNYRYMYNSLSGIVGKNSAMTGCDEGNDAN